MGAGFFVSAMTAGCLARSPPASYTFGKLVEADPAARAAGRITVSPSAMWTRNERGASDVAFPVGEAALTLQSARRYTAAVSLLLGKLAIEGTYFIVDDGRFRLGLIHGLGGGFDRSSGSEGSTTTGAADLLAGVFAQIETAGGPWFLGVRSSLGWLFSRASRDGATPTDRHTTQVHVEGAIGRHFRWRGIGLLPELIVARGWYWADSEMGPLDGRSWYVLPTLTFAAPFCDC